MSTLDRRQFLKVSLSGSAFALTAQLLPGRALMAADHEGGLSPSLFVNIDSDGTVSITCHRSEMGQHVRTSIVQVVADELEANFDDVQVIQAPGDPAYGDQNTDGSRSIRRNLTRLRQAGATARQMLRQAAAERWGVDIRECDAVQNVVTHTPSGRSLGYGELAAAAGRLPVPEADSVELKSRDQWRYIGKAIKHVDLDAVTSGQAVFGFDVKMENLHIAVIARPPVLFGTVKSLDDSAARAIPGVINVVQLPALQPPAVFNALGGVAVIATSTWAAMRGRDALKIEWDHGDNASYNSPEYMQSLLETARQPAEVVRQRGDAPGVIASAAHKVSAEYTAPHLSQAPMEPPAATARVSDGKAEIWACTQTPQSTRATVAGALGLEPEAVTVNVTLLGGAFGRKSKPDFSVEAALLSREQGAPVKVLWTREDDIRNGYYHSVSAQRIEAALDDEGNTTAWHHRTVFPTIFSTFNPAAMSPGALEMGLGFVDNPFVVPNMQLERGQAKGHVRIGWLRSVANVYHAFATQSFAHELAVAAKADPKDYLLKLIGPPRHIDLAAEGAEYPNYDDPLEAYPIDTGRLANVVRRVAEQADWSGKRAQGRALGIAAHRSFLTYVATIVEVSVDTDGRWKVDDVFVSIDAGTIVNPDDVRAQCEGGSIYGLSCAIGQITATNGVVDQGNFNDYKVATMPQSPHQVHVDIVESDAPPAGVGEPPTPPFAPALVNALYEATGTRIRDLPVPPTIVTS